MQKDWNSAPLQSIVCKETLKRIYHLRNQSWESNCISQLSCHCYDQITDIHILKEDRFILHHGFRVVCPMTPRQMLHGRRVWSSKAARLWQMGRRAGEQWLIERCQRAGTVPRVRVSWLSETHPEMWLTKLSSHSSCQSRLSTRQPLLTYYPVLKLLCHCFLFVCFVLLICLKN